MRHPVASATAPSSASSPTAESRSPSISNGTLVHHPLFGQGVVLEVQGKGSKQKVRIAFRNAGEKTLMVQYANLKIQTS
jgi:DNA helicase-2/ATP-dependent DNA helicase PcrA